MWPGVATMIGTLACMPVAEIKMAAESANIFEVFIQIN